jgi:hypothetical protein
MIVELPRSAWRQRALTRLFATRPRPRGVPPGGVCSRRRTNRISSLAARRDSKANPTSGRQRNACGRGGIRQPDRSSCRRCVGLPCRCVVGRAMIERVVLQRDDNAITSTPRCSHTGFIRGLQRLSEPPRTAASQVAPPHLQIPHYPPLGDAEASGCLYASPSLELKCRHL